MRDVGYYSGSEALTYAQECARTHKAAFSATGSRGWTPEEFESLFQRDSTFLLKAPNGFLVADLLVDEVEILTIAVEPKYQGQKIGRALMNKLDEICTCRKVYKCILEVAEDNHAAIKLYQGFDFQKFAIRDSYFKKNNISVSAILMARSYLIV